MGTEVPPGRYRTQRELCRGGLAVVYLAHDQQHDRPVAIRVLRPELATGDSGERFLREIRLAARLQHPLIVGLLDAGTTDELPPRPFYVMPFIDGQSLRERLAQDGPLPVDEAVRLTREIGDALGAAHRAGFVHRDVKPKNVLIAAGHAMVTDFGIAHAIRSSGGDSLVRLTQAGMSLGTPAYMSPEQVRRAPGFAPVLAEARRRSDAFIV